MLSCYLNFRWNHSDSWAEQSDGEFLPVQMYLYVQDQVTKKTQLLSFKETSIVETMHHVSNVLERIVGRDNVSDELTASCVQLSQCGFNLRRWKLLGIFDTRGVMDVELLQKVCIS